jgi:serine/threonine-protein kinase
MIGETLSHYEIVGKIGAGGMGEVYRARDPRIGREVAIKVIHSSLSQDSKRVARFEQEVRAAGTLNHPNVLAIYDVGHDRGMPFLVTELLEGETLREKIDSGSLTRRKAVEYAAQIADGLAAAHGKSIVHRDLKPDNVFITRDGHLKILDFGLAKLTERDPENPVSTESPTEALTDANAVVGTPGFMSPEQLHGEPADPRSDIFAFGVILYEMISGRRPFVGDTAAEISASIMRDDPAPLSGDDRPVSPTLERVVRQCLEKNPAERFESAHDLAHMLRAVSDTGEVAKVVPITPKKLRWLRPAVAAGAIVVAAVIGWQLLDVRPAPSMPEVQHIVVLPFEADGDDPDDRFLAAGLAETVADGLTIMERETRGAAWVVPYSADLTLEEARKTFNATIGVRGVFRTGRQRLGLDLGLVDVASGRTFIRRALDEDVRNLTGLQKEPVRMVWEMLGFEATPAALEDLENSSTNTVTACRAYVSGRGRLSTAGDEAELQKAVTSLEQAVEEDPGYAPARVALARAFARLFVETRDERWKARAVTAAEYAIGLDDDAAEPHWVLGRLYGEAGQRDLELDAHRRATVRAQTAKPFYSLGRAATDAGEFEEAERALQTAINLRPDDCDGHHALAHLYVQMGRYDAAANQYRHAARAAPENPEGLINLGAVLYFQERREEAKEAFEDALALGPNPIAYSNLGTLYFEEARFGDAAEMYQKGLELAGEDVPEEQHYLAGNLASALHWSGERERSRASFELAIGLAESLLEIDPDNHAVTATLAGYYSMIGQRDRGIELLEALTRTEIRDPYTMGTIAESYEDLGDRDRAVQWIGTALDNGLTVNWIERRPSFNSLREDVRYRKIVRQSANRG